MLVRFLTSKQAAEDFLFFLLEKEPKRLLDALEIGDLGLIRHEAKKLESNRREVRRVSVREWPSVHWIEGDEDATLDALTRIVVEYRTPDSGAYLEYPYWAVISVPAHLGQDAENPLRIVR